MNINEILDHQEQIRHQTRIAHLEEYAMLEWWKRLWHKTSTKVPTIPPLALTSAEAACSCLF
jgi:hypothetical protein